MARASAEQLESAHKAQTDELLLLQEQMSKSAQSAAEHEARGTILSDKVAQAEAALQQMQREQEMASEHHRVKIAALDRTHSEAVSKLASSHESTVRDHASKVGRLESEVAAARASAERADVAAESHQEQTAAAFGESRQHALEVERLVRELQDSQAEGAAAKAATEAAQALLDTKALEYQALLAASSAAASEAGELDETMSELTARVKTEKEQRAVAERQAAEHLAALQHTENEVSVLSSLVVEHKEAAREADLTSSEAKKSSAEADRVAAEMSRALAESQAALSELRRGPTTDSTKTEGSQTAREPLDAGASDTDSAGLLRREMAEMEQRMASEVADIARQAAERVMAAEQRLQDTIAMASAAQEEAAELRSALEAHNEQDDDADADAGKEASLPSEETLSAAFQKSLLATHTGGAGRTEPASSTPVKSGRASRTPAASGGQAEPSPLKADDSLVTTQAKLAISEERLKQARLEARVRASFYQPPLLVCSGTAALLLSQALRTRLVDLQTEGDESLSSAASSLERQHRWAAPPIPARRVALVTLAACRSRRVAIAAGVSPSANGAAPAATRTPGRG